jgi:hypothetical protein
MAAGTPYPKPYQTRSPPSLPDPTNSYLTLELRSIQETLRGVLDMMPQDAIAAPAAPREGMMRLAKSPWRPVAGQTADKWVTYVNGAWAYLANT